MTFNRNILGRRVQFDERSRNFPIRELVKMKRPRSYTWRCNSYLDQGSDGACVGFGVSHELIARPAEAKGITYDYAMELYWEAQKIDPWEGGAYDGAEPFYEGTSVLAGVKAAQRDGWFDEYRWAFGLNDLILGVGYNGPAVIGVNWYEGMMDTDKHGYIKPTGRALGGHCILCNAINVKKKRFTLHNSWGINWGNNGECYISFHDMDTLLYNNGEAVFFLHRHRKARRRTT
ncbi:MAG: hypothetical protein DRO67_02020 [Candidatus Asgardarchaeum californiense]|nr:MAG: hypothetical protein DRO67_02020 [Candidatus Asgardarchaeum californiense]